MPVIGKDEVAEMAGAFVIFKDHMIQAEQLRSDQAAQAKRSEAQMRQAMLDLADKFEINVGDLVNGVTASATELQATAQSMATTAEETSRQATAVAAASEESTNNVQTVAPAPEERLDWRDYQPGYRIHTNCRRGGRRSQRYERQSGGSLGCCAEDR